MPDYVSVDDYIARQGPEAQPMLHQLRQAVRAALPRAEESISGYNMPTYRIDGRAVAYFGAAKKHCALYGVEQAGFEEELVRYGGATRGTLRFSLGEKLPVGLVKRLVKARAASQAALGPLKRR
jgi:uncharacterized protein YdhG (YjbR/CyaY superfamily)